MPTTVTPELSTAYWISRSLHPRMFLTWERYNVLGNPRILGQGGYLVYPILGYSWDGRDTWEPQDTWTRGVFSSPHPRMLLGWGRYLGIPGYLDKGEVSTCSSPHPRMLPGWERYLGILGYLDKGGI